MIRLRQLALIIDLVRITLHQLLIRPDALSGPAVQYAAQIRKGRKTLLTLMSRAQGRGHSWQASAIVNMHRGTGMRKDFPLLHQPLDLIEHAQRKFVIRREFQLDAIFRI